MTNFFAIEEDINEQHRPCPVSVPAICPVEALLTISFLSPILRSAAFCPTVFCSQYLQDTLCSTVLYNRFRFCLEISFFSYRQSCSTEITDQVEGTGFPLLRLYYRIHCCKSTGRLERSERSKRSIAEEALRRLLLIRSSSS